MNLFSLSLVLQNALVFSYFTFLETKNSALYNNFEKSFHLFQEVERFGDFLKYYNVSECSNGTKFNGSSYVKRHILNGLLLDHDVPASHWEEFKSVFNKNFRSARHERAALRKWRENLKTVTTHNRQYLAGEQSYSLHLNMFGDFGSKDYVKHVLTLIDSAPLHDPFEDHHKAAFRRTLHRATPREVDWRTAGYRPRREQQWHCGACYAFAVAHALQAQLYRHHRDWTELSAQQIVDCSAKDGNFGCSGGSLRAALRYVAREGLYSERDYPYKGKIGVCRAPRPAPRAPLTRPHRWALLPAGDEAGMERALSAIGPLAVAVNASPRTFQLYRSGIYDDIFCSPWVLNHAMLLVGYTPEYWVLLNWWGRSWGEDGYIRIRRGFNRCGVANMAAYIEL